MRVCGACSVCCEVAAVPELGKPPLQRCHLQVEAEGGCCSIVGDTSRPRICDEYRCAWLDGVGDESDRPDKAGAMFSVNRTERGRIGYCVETDPGAVRTTARGMAVAFSRALPMPLIVVSEEAQDGHVVIADALAQKAQAMLGPLVDRLASDVSMYERKDP